MNWTEFAKEIPIGRFIKDLGVFSLSPRKFLDDATRENDGLTVQRLACYAILFTLFEVAILGAVSDGFTAPTSFAVVGIATFELVFGLLYVPAFVAVGGLLHVRRPFKRAIVYSVTFRFVWVCIPLVLFGLFLTTEDYTFALARGVAAYLYWIGWILVYPLTIATTIRKRAIAALASVLVAIAIVIGLTEAIGLESVAGGRLAQFSLFYDPIGNELARTKLNFVEFDKDSELRKVEDGVFAVAGNYRNDSAARASFATTIQRWSTTSPGLRTRWNHELLHLDSLQQHAHFELTRVGISKRIALLQAAVTAADAVDTFLRAPSTPSSLDMMHKLVDAHESQNEGLKWQLSVLTVWGRLRSAGLVVCGCEWDGS